MPLLSQKRFDLYPKIGSLAKPEGADSYQFGQVVINSKTVFLKTDFSIAVVNKRCVVPGRILPISIFFFKM